MRRFASHGNEFAFAPPSEPIVIALQRVKTDEWRLKGSCGYRKSLCLCMAEEADALSAAANLLDTEAEEEPTSGFPFADLEALFEEDVSALGLETVDVESNGDSPEAMKWSEEDVLALGLETVDAESNGDSPEAMKWSEDNIRK